MKNCSDIQELLSGYLDGELPEDQHAAVAGHLDACRECSAVLTDFERIERIAHGAAVSDEHWQGVWANVRSALPAPRRRTWLRPRNGLAAAAALLIAAGLTIILGLPHEGRLEPAWEVLSAQAGSSDLSVAYSYDAQADLTVIWVLPTVPEDGVIDDDGAT